MLTPPDMAEPLMPAKHEAGCRDDPKGEPRLYEPLRDPRLRFSARILERSQSGRVFPTQGRSKLWKGPSQNANHLCPSSTAAASMHRALQSATRIPIIVRWTTAGRPPRPGTRSGPRKRGVVFAAVASDCVLSAGTVFLTTIAIRSAAARLPRPSGGGTNPPQARDLKALLSRPARPPCPPRR